MKTTQIIAKMNMAKTRKQIKESINSLGNANVNITLVEVKNKVKDIILNDNEIIQMLTGRECENPHTLLGEDIFDYLKDESNLNTTTTKKYLFYDVEEVQNSKVITILVKSHPHCIHGESYDNLVDMLSERVMKDMKDNFNKIIRSNNMSSVSRRGYYTRQITFEIPCN